MRAVWILVVACSSAAPPPAEPTPVPGPTPAVPTAPAPAVAPVANLDRGACDKPHAWRPTHSFLASERVAHLRVASVRWGPAWESRRCGLVELELVEALRGTMPKRQSIVISQSTLTSYRARPAGAWWVVEQTLEVGAELVAFCPAGASLEGTCTVVGAKDALADVRFARDAEVKPELADVLKKAWSQCATAGHVAATYLWERFRAEALKDAPTYGELVALVEMPTCGVGFRAAMLHAVQDPAIDASVDHVTRLAQAMFALLATPAAIDLHANLVETWIPNRIGLGGGATRLTAKQVFGSDARRRTEAALALGKLPYPGARALLDWIRR